MSAWGTAHVKFQWTFLSEGTHRRRLVKPTAVPDVALGLQTTVAIHLPPLLLF